MFPLAAAEVDSVDVVAVPDGAARAGAAALAVVTVEGTAVGLGGSGVGVGGTGVGVGAAGLAAAVPAPVVTGGEAALPDPAAPLPGSLPDELGPLDGAVLEPSCCVDVVDDGAETLPVVALLVVAPVVVALPFVPAPAEELVLEDGADELEPPPTVLLEELVVASVAVEPCVELDDPLGFEASPDFEESLDFAASDEFVDVVELDEPAACDDSVDFVDPLELED